MGPEKGRQAREGRPQWPGEMAEPTPGQRPKLRCSGKIGGVSGKIGGGSGDGGVDVCACLCVCAGDRSLCVHTHTHTLSGRPVPETAASFLTPKPAPFPKCFLIIRRHIFLRHTRLLFPRLYMLAALEALPCSVVRL